jgi:hypothetical protein
MEYSCEEGDSHFQRAMRKKSAKLRDHVCKPKNPLDTKRMELVPYTPGANWQQLPNIRVQASHDTIIIILGASALGSKDPGLNPARV